MGAKFLKQDGASERWTDTAAAELLLTKIPGKSAC